MSLDANDIRPCGSATGSFFFFLHSILCFIIAHSVLSCVMYHEIHHFFCFLIKQLAVDLPFLGQNMSIECVANTIIMLMQLFDTRLEAIGEHVMKNTT